MPEYAFANPPYGLSERSPDEIRCHRLMPRINRDFIRERPCRGFPDEIRPLSEHQSAAYAADFIRATECDQPGYACYGVRSSGLRLLNSARLSQYGAEWNGGPSWTEWIIRPLSSKTLSTWS